jgi:hypothetical protein
MKHTAFLQDVRKRGRCGNFDEQDSMLACVPPYPPPTQSTQQYVLDYYQIDFLEEMKEISHMYSHSKLHLEKVIYLLKDGVAIKYLHLIAMVLK